MLVCKDDPSLFFPDSSDKVVIFEFWLSCSNHSVLKKKQPPAKNTPKEGHEAQCLPAGERGGEGEDTGAEGRGEPLT